MPPLIGLTGYRRTGKSTFCAHLVDAHGFRRAHPFAGGKAACAGYFMHLGADAETARRMVDGDLKDAPCELLPGRAAPRALMEPLGRFMGVDLGPDWTLGREILRLRRLHPESPLVVESVAYESGTIRDLGGVIVRIDRTGTRGLGTETDRAVDAIVPDHVFVNDDDDPAEAVARFDRFLVERALVGSRRTPSDDGFLQPRGRIDLDLEPDPC